MFPIVKNYYVVYKNKTMQLRLGSRVEQATVLSESIVNLGRL
jgi:hypothetical protein